jgi:hypothetical protein
MKIEDLYEQAKRLPSDINEHVEYMRDLGKSCSHITEFGVRSGVSTIAWAAASPKILHCYDLVRWGAVDAIEHAAKKAGVGFRFHLGNVLEVDIEHTDLLFIDTLHTYDQLQAELQRHADKASRFIVLHDTTTFGNDGELTGSRGLWPAVEEFLAAQPAWKLHDKRTHNNGLTVLRRG